MGLYEDSRSLLLSSILFFTLVKNCAEVNFSKNYKTPSRPKPNDSYYYCLQSDTRKML